MTGCTPALSIATSRSTNAGRFPLNPLASTLARSSSTGRERGHRAELRMTALLALITVTTWGVWIPLAQIVPSISQHTRTFYVTVGNLAFATCALLIGGGHLDFGWRTFWLPLAGGVVWTAGNFSAF